MSGGSRNFQYGEQLNLQMCLVKDLASITYYYHYFWHRECVYSCNDSDIGLQPGSGLKSPMPSVMEIRAERPSKDRPPTTAKGLLSTTKMASKEAESLNRKVLYISLYHKNSENIFC